MRITSSCGGGTAAESAGAGAGAGAGAASGFAGAAGVVVVLFGAGLSGVLVGAPSHPSVATEVASKAANRWNVGRLRPSMGTSLLHWVGGWWVETTLIWKWEKAVVSTDAPRFAARRTRSEANQGGSVHV